MKESSFSKLDVPISSDDDPTLFSWTTVFRSWFWRLYDHLFHLVFYNFCWFMICFFIGWLAKRVGFFGTIQNINLLSVFVVFITESIVSIGWAYLVFRIFIEGEAEFRDLFHGLKKYLIKAVGLSAISFLIIVVCIYNILFYYHLPSQHFYLNVALIGFILWALLFWLSSALYQWPILFFQDPPFFKIIYRSFLLVIGNSFSSLVVLVLFIFTAFFFTFALFLWFLIGMVFFFSIQCVLLEKNLLRYKITFKDQSVQIIMESLIKERKRGWREIIRPWEKK